ncbi:MAG: glycoside hydrolase family 25 protein [Acidobacteriaceae bacterium]
MLTFGVDVSHWEGFIDWQTASRWVPFVYYKATDGTKFVDNTFTHNQQSCNSLGMPHAPYHYYQAEQDPIAQANFFISTVGRLYKRYILDLEDPPGTKKIAAELLAFLKRCEQLTGIKPAVYTSAGYWNEFVLPRPTWSHNYELLVAHYTLAHTPTLPVGWKSFVVWQFSEHFYFPGCSAAADGDWFNGDLRQAREWFGNYRQVDPPTVSYTRLRSYFDGLHVRQQPDKRSRELDHLNKGDQVTLEELGGKDVWVRHAKGWTCVEKDGYRYMEVIKE